MLKMILTIKKKYYTGEWEGGDSNPEDIEVGPPFLLETLEKDVWACMYV